MFIFVLEENTYMNTKYIPSESSLRLSTAYTTTVGEKNLLFKESQEREKEIFSGFYIKTNSFGLIRKTLFSL
jgi:hypothetical protein